MFVVGAGVKGDQVAFVDNVAELVEVRLQAWWGDAALIEGFATGGSGHLIEVALSTEIGKAATDAG